jgi:hypothetical protein
MKATFDINLTSRKTLELYLNTHTLSQLNTIPEGFSNNLIWNIGHIVVVQQLLVHHLSGLPMYVSDELVAKYRKGTKPEHTVTQEEVDEIKSLLFTTVEQTQLDFQNNRFQEYTEFTTMTGYHISNAKDAMEFNNYHEAIHTGIIMQIQKFLLH